MTAVAAPPSQCAPAPHPQGGRGPVARDPEDSPGRPGASQDPGGGQEPTAAARVLASRVDWLTVAFQVAGTEVAARDVLERIEAAERNGIGRAVARVADRIFEVRGTRNHGRFVLTNADVVVTLDLAEPNGWNVAVEFSGSRIARTHLLASVALARQLARHFGLVKGERIRRLDLCADVESFDLDALQGCEWVKARRARAMSVSTEDIAKQEIAYVPARRTYERGGRVTGVVICPGNTISLVAYDKREELRGHTDDRKREFEESIWREAGWDGLAAVARVEFRLKTESLAQLRVRDKLDELPDVIDSLWQYLTRKWVRLIVSGTHSRRTKCDVDDRWKVVQEHKFFHDAGKAKRQRLRGGASSALVFGAGLSRLASEGAIPTERAELDGNLLEDVTFHVALEEEIRNHLVSLARPIANDFVCRFGGNPIDALDFVRQRSQAALARFSGEDNGSRQCRVSIA